MCGGGTSMQRDGRVMSRKYCCILRGFGCPQKHACSSPPASVTSTPLPLRFMVSLNNDLSIIILKRDFQHIQVSPFYLTGIERQNLTNSYTRCLGRTYQLYHGRLVSMMDGLQYRGLPLPLIIVKQRETYNRCAQGFRAFCPSPFELGG